MQALLQRDGRHGDALRCDHAGVGGEGGLDARSCGGLVEIHGRGVLRVDGDRQIAIPEMRDSDEGRKIRVQQTGAGLCQRLPLAASEDAFGVPLNRGW